MTYDIFSYQAPKMPKPTNSTNFVKLVLSHTSQSMREPLLPMIFPAVSSFLRNVKFEYNDTNLYELCGQMGHLIGNSGVGKAQLTGVIEAIMRPFRQHDEVEYQKLAEWQRQMKTKGANKEKPERPEIALWFPPADVTNPAFLQNAIALEKEGRTQYLNLPEVEMANRMCGGHQMVSQMVRNIYDCQRAGALRATADGVSGNPILRANITFTSTPNAARKFYKNDLDNGFFGRIPFAFKAREERSAEIPKHSRFSDDFYRKLDGYLVKLSACQGEFLVKPLNAVVQQLSEEMLDCANFADDDILFELSHRSIFAAWKKGCVLWLLNDQIWTPAIGDFVKWFCYYDLWSKIQVFGDMFENGAESESDGKRGPKNMLDDLPGTFNEAQLAALRQKLGKNGEGARQQLHVWMHRGFITYDEETRYYAKTMGYLDGSLRKRKVGSSRPRE